MLSEVALLARREQPERAEEQSIQCAQRVTVKNYECIEQREQVRAERRADGKNRAEKVNVHFLAAR